MGIKAVLSIWNGALNPARYWRLPVWPLSGQQWGQMIVLGTRNRLQDQRGSLTLGLGITIAVLSAALAGMGWLYNGALKEKARVQGEYEAFKGEAQRLGEVALKENAKILKDRERIANERIKSLGARARAATERADKLCKSAGLSAGCRALPAVPDTARPVDDTGFNQRLLEVLRHAQTVADQLAELQAWISDQQKPAQSL